jgi:hypothetical protein
MYMTWETLATCIYNYDLEFDTWKLFIIVLLFITNVLLRNGIVAVMITRYSEI